MIRKGRFALWNNEEYELVSYQRQYYLQSKNPSDLAKGFVKTNGNEHIFIKPVSVEEIDDAYEIVPYAMISGYRFAVKGFNEGLGTIALVTNNPFVKEKIAVRPYGKFEYIIEIPKDEILIEEDLIPISGF
ncbi:hypothetical protein FITA111629_11790 [Filibacter tadaridae]|uniref:Uncharacterized protein n=1 Tax=Filibacter tadaridae TaxID=2483811 RepID=A0A3P5WNH3_9BACL|nr:hypothetical protein [Filibacter tadaridae]VDC21081.1 hypothetical protein FILTAD_00555 [Filibacter tadaridae]